MAIFYNCDKTNGFFFQPLKPHWTCPYTHLLVKNRVRGDGDTTDDYTIVYNGSKSISVRFKRAGAKRRPVPTSVVHRDDRPLGDLHYTGTRVFFLSETGLRPVWQKYGWTPVYFITHVLWYAGNLNNIGRSTYLQALGHEFGPPSVHKTIVSNTRNREHF